MFGTAGLDDYFGGKIGYHWELPPVRKRAVILSTCAIVLFALFLCILVGIAAAMPPAMVAAREFSPQEVDIMVQGYQDQVALMLQIGAPMVAGLAAAVAFLVHALLRGHRVLINEVRSSAEERVNLGKTIESLACELHERKCLLQDGKHRKEYSQ